MLDAQAGGVDVTFWESADELAAALPGVCDSHSVGVVVVPGPPRGRFAAARAGAALGRMSRLGKPVLFSRGADRVGGVVVPIGGTGTDTAFRAAVDLAHYAGVPLTAVAVLSPAFLDGGSDGESHLAGKLERLRAEAAAQSVTLETRVCRGNPVREITSAAIGFRLLVVEAPRRTPSALVPSLVGHLLARVEPSVLVVPGPS